MMNKILFLLTLNYILIISSFTTAQYAPLQLGNVWVYESYTGTRGRVEIIDSAITIDSIKYFGYAFAYLTNISGLNRLRTDDYYVIKEDSTFPEPLNERIYYKKNAELWDTWESNYGV